MKLPIWTYEPTSPFPQVQPAFWLNGDRLRKALTDQTLHDDVGGWVQKASHYAIEQGVEHLRNTTPASTLTILDCEYADPKVCPPDEMAKWIDKWRAKPKPGETWTPRTEPICFYGWQRPDLVPGTSSRREDWIAEAQNPGSQPLIRQTVQMWAPVFAKCEYVLIDAYMLGPKDLTRDRSFFGEMTKLVRREAPGVKVLISTCGAWIDPWDNNFSGIQKGQQVVIAQDIKYAKPDGVVLWQPTAGRDDALVKELSQ